MASREPVTITLGDQSFKIRPLTLGQVERIEAALATKTKPVVIGMAIVEVALSRDHSQIAVSEIEANAKELSTAMSQILSMAFEMGEAPAAAAKAQNGETYEDVSLPAAA